MFRKALCTILITAVAWTILVSYMLSLNFGNKPHEKLKYKAHYGQMQSPKTVEFRTQATNGSASASVSGNVIPVLVIACYRIQVQDSIHDLIRLRPNNVTFPIYVSQGCQHPGTRDAILQFGDAIHFLPNHDATVRYFPNIDYTKIQYYNIALHYKKALHLMFSRFGYRAAIVVEDDMTIAVDFYEYFLATYPLLLQDKTMLCVSAWNDNGAAYLINVRQPDLLYRTDFFPGLGWMILKDLWKELEPKWPVVYWDDWLRLPEQRLGRSCIRPEISRTHTFGMTGASKGLFYKTYLTFNVLNNQFVSFTKLNLTYLLKSNFDVDFMTRVNNSALVTGAEILTGHPNITTDEVRLTYNSEEEFNILTNYFHLMPDLRGEVSRSSYRGVTPFYSNGTRFYLTSSDWTTSYSSSFN